MRLLQTENSNTRVWQLLAWTVLLTYCLFTGLKYAQNIILVEALGGWSPLDWAAHELLQNNFKADFPSGISSYRMSSIMQLYVFVASFGIKLEELMPWVIQFEPILLGVSAAALFRILSPQSPYVAMIIFAVFMVEGGARDMDLSRFAGTFYQGLYYNFADVMILLGLAGLFKGRIVIAALFFSLGFTIHPLMTGIACLFAVPYIVLNFSQFHLRRMLFAGGVFFILSGLWFFLIVQSAEVTSGAIPKKEWLALVRMFTYHWFPVDIGVFTAMHNQYIMPLLCLVSLAAFYLPRVIQERKVWIGIAWGMALLVLLVFSGVVISEFSSEPFLVKLALHRSSRLLILLSLLIVVAGLTQGLLNGTLIEAALSAAMILSPLINAPVAFPLVPTMMLLSIYAVREWKNRDKSQLMIAAPSILVLFFVLVSYYFMGMLNIEYLGRSNFWWATFLFLFLALLQRCCNYLRFQGKFIKTLASLILLIMVLFYAVKSVEQKSAMPNSKKELAFDYLATQQWANISTSPTSLFMVDPTIYYGWRDFSQRSSFGNLREWLHTSWLYDSKETRFREGLTRFSEFGIDIEPYKTIRPSITGFDKLSEDLRNIFYSKEDAWFIEISRRYGVDYLVIRKEFLLREYPFTKIFENAHFLVYRLPER